MAIQSAVDEAVKLGLAIYGWIEVSRDDSAAGEVRRVVEAYPNLDGYFLHRNQGLPAGENAPPEESPELITAELSRTAQQLLPGYILIPVLNIGPEMTDSNFRALAKALERQPRIVLRPDSAASILDAVQQFRILAPETDLIVVLPGWDIKEGEIDEQIANAESEGANGALIANIPIAQSFISPPLLEGATTKAVSKGATKQHCAS